jgi:ferrous iron transport protein B
MRAVENKKSKPSIALIGNPNCGKTTLFNALTGLSHKVGNYPGVTVEKKIGQMMSQHGSPIDVIDLPGTYSLSPRSPDEAISRDVLLGDQSDMPPPDVVVCVVDASNLERNLYLVTQIIDLGLPVLLALNMVDVAEVNGMRIDGAKLAEDLGVPVVPCQANNRHGIAELRIAVSKVLAEKKSPKSIWQPPPIIATALCGLTTPLTAAGISNPAAHAMLLLSDRYYRESADSIIPKKIRDAAAESAEKIHEEAGKGASDIVVEARYARIQEICDVAVSRESAETGLSFSDRLDMILVHRVWGWVCFAGLMLLMFLSIFTFATIPMDMIDAGFGALGEKVSGMMPDGDLRGLIVDGIIGGVGGVLIFLPQILILFLFIGLLESSGYMARAAFIMDRLMKGVGLNGRSFIPMLSSYACAIPGVMAARTIENPKDRLITILVAPFMSCSARLPVYTVLIAALFPPDQVSIWTKVWIMFGLYALGTGGAFFFAWIFKQTLGKREKSMFLMELPPYRRPVLSAVLRQMFERGMIFVRRAGTVILGLSILLWASATYPKSEGSNAEQLENSYMGSVGKVIEPVVAPLGYDWKIGVGIAASFAAREVFVSTMGVVYGVENEDDQGAVLEKIRAARRSDGSVLYTPLVCISLLVFFVYAMQCISTVAVVKRETNSWKWPMFQLAYMSGFAYLMALIVYQGGRFLGYE